MDAYSVIDEGPLRFVAINGRVEFMNDRVVDPSSGERAWDVEVWGRPTGHRSETRGRRELLISHAFDKSELPKLVGSVMAAHLEDLARAGRKTFQLSAGEVMGLRGELANEIISLGPRVAHEIDGPFQSVSRVHRGPSP